MGKTLKALAQVIGIQALHTSVCHPQTNGLVQRFNGTLKQMIRKFITNGTRDWHRWLPFLLFTVREVPQASLGFSPFELLYGRHPRGILDIVRKEWETMAQSIPINPDAYVTALRAKFKQVAELAQRELVSTQEGQKRRYDAKVQCREFQVGQMVLLL